MRLFKLLSLLFACAALAPALATPSSAQCVTCEAQEAFEKGDFARAVRLFRPLADQGNVLSQTALGAMYEIGDGVRQDNVTAAAWYRKAAEQGFAVAQISLAGMYEQGRGVSLDYVQAFKWYCLAMGGFDLPGDNTAQEAKERRDLVAAKMTSAQIAEGMSLVREWARQWRERAAIAVVHQE
jgi:TPR repeat protein